MSRENPSRVGQKNIDASLIWTGVRGLQILLVIFFAKEVYLSRNTPDFELDLSSAILTLLIITSFWHPICTGWADPIGIHYRRYFRVKTISWSNVKEIQWRGYHLLVVRKEGSFLFRKTLFFLNPLRVMGPYYAQRFGNGEVIPEPIERIIAIPKNEPVSIVTAPSLIKWRLRVFLAFALLFLLVVLLRLLLAFQN